MKKFNRGDDLTNLTPTEGFSSGRGSRETPVQGPTTTVTASPTPVVVERSTQGGYTGLAGASADPTSSARLQTAVRSGAHGSTGGVGQELARVRARQSMYGSPDTQVNLATGPEGQRAAVRTTMAGAPHSKKDRGVASDFTNEVSTKYLVPVKTQRRK